MPLKCPHQQREYRKKYYLEHRAEILARERAWRAANPGENAKRCRAQYHKRWADPIKRKKILAENKLREQANPNWGRERSLRWRNKNLEKARANEHRWRKAHPEYTASKTLKRWALKRKAQCNLVAIKAFVKMVKQKKTVTCYYCEQPTQSKGCHFDHIVPLSKGGPHNVTNLCVSCPSCNHSKHAKSVEAWVRVGQQVFSL